MKYCHLINVVDVKEFITQNAIPDYAEYHVIENRELGMLDMDETISFPEDKKREFLDFTHRYYPSLRVCIEPTYAVFDYGESYEALCTPIFESESLEDIKDWISETDADKAYTVFKDRLPFSFE